MNCLSKQALNPQAKPDKGGFYERKERSFCKFIGKLFNAKILPQEVEKLESPLMKYFKFSQYRRRVFERWIWLFTLGSKGHPINSLIWNEEDMAIKNIVDISGEIECSFDAFRALLRRYDKTQQLRKQPGESDIEFMDRFRYFPIRFQLFTKEGLPVFFTFDRQQIVAAQDMADSGNDNSAQKGETHGPEIHEGKISKKSGELTIKANLIASGSLGVASDLALFEKHLYGAQAVSGGVSVVNSFSKHPEDTLFGLSVHFVADFAAWHIKGFVPDQIVYSLPGDDEATVEITGQAAEIIQTGYSTLAAALIGGEASITVQPGDAVNFSTGSKIDVGSSTGHTVSAEPIGDVVQVSPIIVGAQSIGAVVTPNILTGTTSGVVISGIAGSFQLDAVEVKSVSHTITVKANRSIRNKTYGSATPDGFYSAQKREVSFESEIYLSRPNFKYLTGAQKLIQYDLQLIAGDTAANRVKFDMNKVELEIPAIETNDDDEAMVTLSGSALPTTGEDEATQTYD